MPQIHKMEQHMQYKENIHPGNETMISSGQLKPQKKK